MAVDGNCSDKCVLIFDIGPDRRVSIHSSAIAEEREREREREDERGE